MTKPNKCKICSNWIQKGTLCQPCLGKSLRSHLNAQLCEDTETLIIPINDLLARNSADIIKRSLSNHKETKYLELVARGRHITRAIDILEILKRELKIADAQLKTGTEDLINKGGKIVKVSKIEIILTRE